MEVGGSNPITATATTATATAAAIGVTAGYCQVSGGVKHRSCSIRIGESEQEAAVSGHSQRYRIWQCSRKLERAKSPASNAATPVSPTTAIRSLSS